MINRLSSIIEDVKFISTSKKKAFCIGWTGHENLGDEALYIALKGLFGKQIRFYEKRHVGKGVNWFMETFDYLFLGGGTLINRSGPDVLNRLTSTKARRKIVFGTGVGNPEYWSLVPGSYSNTVGWAEALNTVDYVGVRGPLSVNLLKEWGVTREVVELGDLALYFAQDQIRQKPRRKILGINIGNTNNQLWGGSDRAFIDRLVAELTELGYHGWDFLFFPVTPKDMRITEDTMRRLSGFKVECVENYLDLDEYLNKLNSVDIFIGEKLHSVILAICTHTPSIMLEYRPKCRDFMASIAMEEFNVKANVLEPGLIRDMVEDMYDQQISLQDRIFRTIVPIKKRIINEAKKVLELK